MKKKIPKYIIYICVMLAVTVFLSAMVFYFHALHYSNDAGRKNDVAAVSGQAYEMLLLTMYSGETFSTYPFEYYLGASTYKAEHSFQNLSDITDYINHALSANDSISKMFILFESGSVNADFFHSSTLSQAAYRQMLRKSIAERQDVEFAFLLPSYSLDFWSSLDDREIEEYLDSFVLFCNEFNDLENVKIYYFGDLEWLIANPSNYSDGKNCTEEVNNKLAALTLANDDYLITSETVTFRFESLKEQVVREKASPRSLYDLSEYAIVFFGDSIIGNYSGSMSIPGIVSSLTGADVYNCAIGGQAATSVPGEEEASFNGTLGYFLGEEGVAAPEGKTQYVSEVARFQQTDHTGKKLCFVLEYGLNDYFSGRAIYNPSDNGDIYTYSGALSRGIARIQQAYPDADIILLTPTYTLMFENGTAVQSERGGSLSDYAEAVKELSEELELPLVDNYEGLGVNETNGSQYMEDGTHYNERGRYMIAQYLIAFMADYYGCDEY